jgi:hypothetical protein
LLVLASALAGALAVRLRQPALVASRRGRPEAGIG